jgi:hypothetical protein
MMVKIVFGRKLINDKEYTLTNGLVNCKDLNKYNGADLTGTEIFLDQPKLARKTKELVLQDQ